MLNPLIIRNKKCFLINEIKEEQLEESNEQSKNELKIFITNDNSNDETSTSDSSHTPKTPITPNINTQRGLMQTFSNVVLDINKSDELKKQKIINDKKNEFHLKKSVNSEIKDNKKNKKINYNENSNKKIRNFSSKKSYKSNKNSQIEKNDNVKKSNSVNKNNSAKNYRRSNTVENENKKKIVFKEKNQNQTNIMRLKVEKEINSIFQNLPEDYEIIPEIKNKFELIIKNINDIKCSIMTQKNFHPRKSRFEGNNIH